LTPFRGKIGV